GGGLPALDGLQRCGEAGALGRGQTTGQALVGVPGGNGPAPALGVGGDRCPLGLQPGPARGLLVGGHPEVADGGASGGGDDGAATAAGDRVRGGGHAVTVTLTVDTVTETGQGLPAGLLAGVPEQAGRGCPSGCPALPAARCICC